MLFTIFIVFLVTTELKVPRLLSKNLATLVIISMVIATPLAWYFLTVASKIINTALPLLS